MRAQTSLLPSEPTTHLAGCHWRQWLFCQDYALNNQQLHAFYTLKEQSNILFQGNNQRWDLIKALYLQYFGEPVKTNGKQWMRLGFQGQYPETDFRGGGVISLQMILRFVKNNRQLVQQMQKDKGNFFFAITAINICFFMKKYFHLADFLTAGKDKHVYCDRKAFKNFCSIISSDQQSFMKIHDRFLRWFYVQKWLIRQKQRPETLLQFNSLFEQFQIRVRYIFQNYKIQNWNDFQILWNEV